MTGWLASFLKNFSELASFLGILHISLVSANHLRSIETHRMVVIVAKKWLVSLVSSTSTNARGLTERTERCHQRRDRRSTARAENQKIFNGQIYFETSISCDSNQFRPVVTYPPTDVRMTGIRLASAFRRLLSNQSINHHHQNERKHPN